MLTKPPDHNPETQPSTGDLSYAPEDWVAFCLFWLLFFTVFMQFSSRYLGLGSFPWTEEGARYLLILLGFSGASLAIRRRSHVAVTMLNTMLPVSVQPVLAVAIGVINTAFYAIAAWLTWQVGVTQSVQRMASVNIPLRYLYWSVAAFLVILTIRSALQIFSGSVDETQQGKGS